MNGLPSWESIIKTPDWQQITDEEKNNVFKSYLKNISQLPDWRQLSQPEKFNVTRAMEKQGGLYEETKRPSIIKELIVPTIKEIPERTISGVKRLGKDISIGARQSFANMYHLLANIPGLEARLVDKVSAITGLPKSDSLKIAEKYLRDAAERVAPSIEEVKDYDSLLDKFTQGIGALPGTLAEYGPIVALKGPTIGMAVVDALRESDKGLVDSLIGGFRGAITGKGLELISGLGLPPAKKAITIGGLFATEPLVKGKYKEAVTSGGLGIVLGHIGGKETKGIRYDAKAIKKLEAIEKAKQYEVSPPEGGKFTDLKKTPEPIKEEIYKTAGEEYYRVDNAKKPFRDSYIYGGPRAKETAEAIARKIATSYNKDQIVYKVDPKEIEKKGGKVTGAWEEGTVVIKTEKEMSPKALTPISEPIKSFTPEQARSIIRLKSLETHPKHTEFVALEISKKLGKEITSKDILKSAKEIEKNNIPADDIQRELVKMAYTDKLNRYAAMSKEQAESEYAKTVVEMRRKAEEIPIEEKIPNKGDILKLSESHKKTLNMVRNDIIQGEAGKKVTNEEGKFILIPSTFPKYFQNRGYSKEGTLKTIDKALRDEPLTQKQQAIIQDLNSGKRQEILEQYKFYKETGVPGGISAIADMGDYALRKMKLPAKPSIPQKSILPISELPEIVELSAKISKGEVPTIVSKLRAGMGKALGQYRKGKTYLKAETAKTPEVAKKTLAHEIGHYIEKLPQDYQTLGKAIKWTSDISSPLLKKQIMDELKVVSQIWKPFNEAENIRFTRYRYSPDELYADAFSVLINEPSLLLEKAPIFVDNFFKNIDKRPEFKKAYKNIQDRLTNENTIIESRHNELTKMMQEGTKALFESPEKGINVWEAIKREFITKNGGIIDAIKKVERKTGQKISNEENPLYLIEEMPYISGQFYQHLRDITNNILNPALKNKISIDDIGMVEFANRVIHERSNIFNPRGHTPETALKELEFLKNKFGEEKYSQILDYINKIAEARAKNIIPVLEQSEMFTPELISIIKDNKYYATFLPHKYIERTYGKGVSGQIFKQIGTFEDIINPFTALMMKDFVLLKSAITKMVKKGSMDWLKNNGFQDQILPAEYKFNGKVNVPIEPRNPKLGMVSYLHKGKVEAFYVPKEIAESFNRSPHEASLIMRTLETLTSPFKDLVVGKNPPWAIWNLFYRDISATAKQLPDASYWKILKLVPKALPHVWKDVMRGESTELMREMYEKRMLTPLRFWRGRDIPPEIAMASEILSLGKPNPNTPIYYATLPFIKLWNALDKPGRISERLTKVAGKIYLKETMPETTVHRVGHLVRARAGTPDLLEGGIRTRTFNTLFVFSNAGIQGMRAAIESAKESPLSYAWKTAKYDILPKTIMQIAKLGFLGTGVATIMSKIPDRDMENYVVVPLGLSVSGKAVYFVKPHDFQGQLVGGIFYNVMNSRKLEDYQSLLDFANGQMPYSSLNPWIQVGIDWLYYMTGKNPYDAWKGSYVLPEKMYEAGGKGALIAMLKHTSNSMGGSSIYRFRGDNPQAIKGELEKIYKVPFLEPALSRFIRVSDYGIQEKAKEDIKKVRKDRAIQYYKNKSILLRLMEGEELTPEDISTLSESVSIDNQLMSLLVAKHGSALGRALFHARSTEERVAIIREFQKREKKIKKRSEFLGGLKEALHGH